MKKIIFAITALLTTMIMIAQPLYVHAADVISVHEYQEINEIGSEELPANIQSRLAGLQYMLNSNAYEENAYFFYTVYKKTNGTSERYYEIFYSFSDATVSFENGYLDINFAVNPIGKSTNEKIFWYNKGSSASGYDDYKTGSTYTHVELRWGDTISVNFYDRNGNNYSPRMGTSGDIANGFCTFVTNIPEIMPQEPTLDLQVTFSPSMTGTVTRQGTSEGADITYNYLNLNIKNNGDNAQWLFCIVPHGQSLSFPNAILNTPQGFIGSPTFVWVTDEWIDWTNGLTGITGNYGGIDMQMLYAPCAWHTLITGSDRTYRINWDMMKLTKDVSYDCVVYGMINEEPVNASDSGTGLGCWTVKSALSGITEVYRSTFTMPNPPEFNPDSIDEGNNAHSWNPDIDNSSLFNTGSVYRDANGNLVELSRNVQS